MKKSFAYPIIFMSALTFLYVFILASFNDVTADTISFNKESELRYSILYIFDMLPKGEDPQEIESVYNKNVVEKKFGDKSGYALLIGGKEKAYAIKVDGSGLWGSIDGFIGLNEDFTQIIGIDFVNQSETPGLGGRISEKAYKEQYRNIPIADVKDGKYLRSSPEPNSNVDAIAGATQTSTAVVKLINDDLNTFFTTQGVK